MSMEDISGPSKWLVISNSIRVTQRIAKASRRHAKLIILERRDMSAFVAEMPDSEPLSSLLLPGELNGHQISQ